MKTASSQLIRAIRGGRSQVALSRRLGYRGNPVADWEAGRRYPTAAEMLRACRLSSIDVRGAFERFHPQAAAAVENWDEPELHAWLDALRGGTSLVELARRAERSRYAVGRWVHGEAKPRVPEFLSLVEAASGRVADFVAELVPIELVSEMAPIHAARLSARRLAFEQPWTEAILRLLELPECHAQHDGVSWIARTLDVERSIVETAVEAMAAAGVIERRGHAWVEVAPLTVDTRGYPEGFNRLRQHWTEVAASRLRAPAAPDWFGYNLFTISVDELEEVRGILSNAYRQIRSLAAASQNPERAALINMQFMTWGGKPPPPSGE